VTKHSLSKVAGDTAKLKIEGKNTKKIDTKMSEDKLFEEVIKTGKKPVKIPRKNTAVDYSALQNGSDQNLSAQELIPESGQKRVVIEYTDPNPFKEFHIGHLISNVVGESLSRLKEASGSLVWRADYFGDVGIHVAKSIWGIQKKMQEDHLVLADLTKKSLIERVNYMGQGYTLGTRAFESDEEAKASITSLNRVLYVVAQTMWKRQGKALTIDYNADGVVSVHDVEAVYELYTQGRKWSLEYFETIYARLGTKFDGYYPESIVGEIGYQYVIDNIGKVFEKSDGAVVFRGEKFGLHTRVFINNKNLPTYEGKELGLAPAKYQDFPYDESIIVVGKEIKEYFAVLVEALKQINPKLGNVTKPIFTGMVNLPEGKMGSRFGNVITVIGLIDKLKKLVNEKIQSFDYSHEQKEEIAERVSIAAVKYSMLRVSLPSDISFDLEASVSFEGDSGPYLQYTYARCKSVLRKAGEFTPVGASALKEEERVLARQVMQFPDVVADAVKNFAPNTICTYLFHLAQQFNVFYAKHQIVGNDFRLTLTAATAQVIKNGLTLLGIETMEQM
jgi:arginyl-tRNA synthetase